MTVKTNKSKREVNPNAVIRRLSFVSIFGNAILSGFKLFAGIFGHSGAMISDAVHSMSDVITTVIAYLGAKISQKPADNSHPYGHDRLESMAALLLGFVLLLTGAGVGKVGIEAILSGSSADLQVPGAIALIAALISILGKEAMYWYTRHYAKLINSAAFMADAWHHRSDALSSVGSFIGIGGAMLGFPILDPIASVVICLFIFKVSYDIIKDAVSKMLDTSCGDIYEIQMSAFIAKLDEVVRVDLLHSRKFGNKVYIDVEIAVDGEKKLRDSHAVAEMVHARVENQYPEVKHVMVHVNPA